MSKRYARGERMWADLVRMVWQQPVYALPFALFFGFLNGGKWHTYVLCYKAAVIFAYCIRICIWAVRHVLLPRLPQPRMEPGRYPVIRDALWIMAGSLVGSYVAAYLVQAFLIHDFLGSTHNVILSGLFTVIFGTLISGLVYATHFYRTSVERARAVERMRAELAQAELRTLRAQIQPHFLFNTLNSIAALIPVNPQAAEETLTRLADVFRYALRASGREHAKLGEELEFVRSYLEIERTRLGERLKVEERVEPGLEMLWVPSLLLQPIVENAVRHGIGTRPEGGTVVVEARRQDERLLLMVSDDGLGMDGDAPRGGGSGGSGFGLHAVRERLRAAGPPHDLEIESGARKGTRVSIFLPWRTTPAEDAPGSEQTKGDVSWNRVNSLGSSGDCC